MKKLNLTLHNKLILQAEEAKIQGFEKLAERVLDAVNNTTEDIKEYSYSEFKEDINHDLWKLATRFLSFYDLKSVDVSKIDNIITILASNVIDELENVLEVNSIVKGAFEPKLPGE